MAENNANESMTHVWVIFDHDQRINTIKHKRHAQLLQVFLLPSEVLEGETVVGSGAEKDIESYFSQ